MDIRNVSVGNLYFCFEAKDKEDFYNYFDFKKDELNLNKWYRSHARSCCGVNHGYYYYIIPMKKNITLKDVVKDVINI